MRKNIEKIPKRSCRLEVSKQPSSTPKSIHSTLREIIEDVNVVKTKKHTM
jgi:hypothetical protein